MPVLRRDIATELGSVSFGGSNASGLDGHGVEPFEHDVQPHGDAGPAERNDRAGHRCCVTDRDAVAVKTFHVDDDRHPHRRMHIPTTR